ncbi:MAG: DUF2318 domain-containing protein, partial [Atopobiaceae bacterium]|nr:DUF2318 domain-containing protein [Atopobiaceae bacterium]
LGLLLFLLMMAPFAHAKLSDSRADLLQQLGIAFMLIGCTGYNATEPLTYPQVILLSVKSVVSSDYFFRIVGWILGLVLMFVLALAVFKVLNALDDRHVVAAAVTGSVFAGLVLIGLALRAMLSLRIIPNNHTVFRIAVFASNNGLLFGIIMGAIALVCVAILLVRSMHVKEPYDNPAQHRKIRAKWRNRRRWATVAIVCLLASLINVTVVKAYDSKEVELSPSEEFELRDDGCYIPLEQVEDGHLHRFTYESPDGVGIRFIVIKKGEGSSYGIGLDACDICGETGYYERDGQVVCKLCDVVMNIRTIGFKGGCNPIVIDYSIKDGYIIVPFETLLENEVIFTR